MLATMKEAENFGLSYDVVDDLTGKKLGRASSRHLPHRRRGGPGHDGARHQDAAGQPGSDRSVLSAAYATPPVLAGADRRRARSARRPAPASTRRSARTSCASTRPRATTCRRRQGRRGRRAHAEEAAGRAPEAAARVEATRRRSSCGRSCATASTTPRCTWPTIAESARDVDFAMRWGFGAEAGPVRAVAGGRLDAGGAVGQGRHRRRQGAVQGAAAGLGVRRPGGRDGGVHTPEGSWSAGAASASCRAEHAAGLPAPARSARPCSAPAPPRRCKAAPRCSRTTRSASGRSTARC